MQREVASSKPPPLSLSDLDAIFDSPGQGKSSIEFGLAGSNEMDRLTHANIATGTVSIYSCIASL